MQFGIPGRDDSESIFPPIESFDRRIIDSLSAQIAILNNFGDALRVIAETYFPESPAPMEEARLGQILVRCQFWLQSVCDTENLPIFNRLHRIELR